MALLGRMQSLLAALYDAPVAHDVHDYLIPIRRMPRLCRSCRRRPGPTSSC